MLHCPARQALPISADMESESEGPRSRSTKRPKIQPHALHEHSARLQGPLEVVTPASQLLSMMDLADAGDTAASLSYTW
jgi:hypothetical protein